MPPIPTLSLITVLLSGCAGVNSGDPWGAWVLYQSEQCPDPDIPAGITWIGDAETFATFYAKSRRLHPALPRNPALDFTRQGAVVVRMGSQPTTGYNLTLLGTELGDETLLIRVEQQSPLPGTRTKRAVTAPCLVLGLPRVPQVVVEDMTGQKLGTITPGQ
ncbi:putative PrcB_C domain-containing protein [Gammaproteobacteria bacterium]